MSQAVECLLITAEVNSKLQKDEPCFCTDVCADQLVYLQLYCCNTKLHPYSCLYIVSCLETLFVSCWSFVSLDYKDANLILRVLSLFLVGDH